MLALLFTIQTATLAPVADSVPRIGDPRLRQPLGSIMVCGAAHVVALKDSLGIFLVN